MSLDRRRFLQGCTGAGVLAAAPALLARPLEALAAPATPLAGGGERILLLRADGDEHFAAAVQQTLRQAGGAHLDMLSLTPALTYGPGALRAALAGRGGTVLLGLMDDGAQTLLEECLRELGGALLCRGQHFGTPSARADSRHLFTTTAGTSGVGAALALALAGGGGAYIVREQACAGEAALAASALPRLDAHWPTALGAAYARMAAGRWTPGAAVAPEQRGDIAATAGAQPRASLVATL